MKRKLTLLDALCSPWNGRFSYSPGSDSRSAASDDLPRANWIEERKRYMIKSSI